MGGKRDREHDSLISLATVGSSVLGEAIDTGIKLYLLHTNLGAKTDRTQRAPQRSMGPSGFNGDNGTWSDDLREGDRKGADRSDLSNEPP
jgi:hypothetical protein